MRKLSDLLTGGVLTTKYSDPGSLVVNVQIKNTLISNTFIDLGAIINNMKYDTMQALGKPPQYFKALIDKPLNQRES